MKKFNPRFLNAWMLKSMFLSCFLLMSCFTVASFASETTNDDSCIYGLCADPGEIGNEQYVERGSAPTELIETKKPTCEPGELEYLWMYYSASSGGWKPIAGSNTKNYQPGLLFSTTYFLRCVRKKGCPTYRESNIIRVEAVDCMPSKIEYGEACLDDAVQFYARTVQTSKAVTYKWTFEGGSPSTYTGQKVDVTFSSTGIKKVTLTVSYGDCEVVCEEEVYVENCNCEGFYCTVSSSSDCGTGSARANGFGGVGPYTYKWSNGATSRRVSGLPIGTSSVTVTDANGCECVKYIFVNAPTEVACKINVVKPIRRCGGKGTIRAYATAGDGPFQFIWSDGAYGAERRVRAGTYEATIIDTKSGCRSTCSITIMDPTVACSVSTSATTCGENNGTATAMGIGGSGHYTFDWGIYGSGSMISGLAPGTYTATVTDTRTWCTSTCSGTVGGSVGPPSCTVSTTDAACNQSNGTATANPTGGTPPYNYVWSTGETSKMITGLNADTYFVTVTDANGCSSTSSCSGVVASPTVPDCSDPCQTLDEATCMCVDIPNVTLDGMPDVMQADCSSEFPTGSVSISASGGMGTLTYTLNPGDISQSTGTFTSLAPGDYSYQVTDGNNCTANDVYGSFTIDECCDLTENSCNECQIFDEDACECVDIDDIVLGDPPFTVTQPDCTDSDPKGSVTINASGGTSLLYSLNGGTPQASNTFSNLTPGQSYTVVVTDASGSTECFSEPSTSFMIDACGPCGEGSEVENCDLGNGEVLCDDCGNLPRKAGSQAYFYCLLFQGAYELRDENCNGIKNGKCPDVRAPISTGGDPSTAAGWTCSGYNTAPTSRLFAPVTDEQIQKAYDIVDKLNNQTQEAGSTNEVELDIINTQATPTAKIFPNPFQENVSIVLSDYTAFAKTLNIEVMNIAGQVIERRVVDAAAATHELNLGEQAKGIYIVRISAENIKPEIHKVVKN